MLAALIGCNDKSNQKADPKTQNQTDSTVKLPKPTTNTDKKSDAKESQKKKDKQASSDKDKEKFLQEKEKSEQAVLNATVLQAPPLQNGMYHETGEFGKKIKDIAENEFRFREAKDKVFRSTFNQKNMEYSAVLKRFHARNAVISPGRFDFDTNLYHLELIFWQHVYEEKKRPKDVIDAPRTDDICRLKAKIKLDTKTAESWRVAIDKNEFSLTIWYRLAKIEQAAWQQNAHWNPLPMPAYDYAFSIEVLKFE